VKTRKFLIGILLILVIAASGGYRYVHYAKSGILWKHGFSADTLKLVTTGGILQFYLYERDDQLGFIVLKKRDNGQGWKFYTQESIPISNSQTSLKMLYHTVKDGNIAVRALWGGRLEGDGAASPNIQLAIRDIPYTPDAISYKKNEYLYFLLHTDWTEMSDTLEVAVP